jgi:hypothetical protein
MFFVSQFSNAALAATTAHASFGGGNVCSTPSGTGTCYTSLISATSTSGLVADTGSVTQLYSGLTSTGTAETGSISGRAWAEASPTTLRSYAEATFDKPLLNSNNTPLFTGGYYSPGTLNPGGVPIAVDSYAIAYINDTVAVFSPTASYVQLTFSLSGSISTNAYPPVYSHASVFQNNGSSAFAGGSNLYLESQNGPFSTTITTNPIPLVNNMFTFGVGLYTEVIMNMLYSPSSELGTFSGVVDYTHTLTLSGISAFSSAGNAAELLFAVGQSGTIYPISPVPEPEKSALLMFGIALIAASIRWKRLER